MPKLILYPGSEDQVEYDLADARVVRVGRSEHNEIVVRRRMASRDHARIEASNGRFFLVDLDSYHGTSVNHRPIRRAELRHGDEIRVASRILRFVDGTGTSSMRAEETLRLSSPPSAGQDVPTLLEFPRPAALKPGPRLEPAGLAASTDVPATEETDHSFTGADRDMIEALQTADDESFADDILAAVDAAIPTRPAGATTGSAPRTATAQPRLNPADTSGTASRGRWLRLAAIALLILPVLGIWLVQNRNPRNAAVELAPDARALQEALASFGETRIARLWSFTRAFPAGRLTARAYEELLAAGVPAATVCGDARERSPDLLRAPPLEEKCAQ